VALDASDVNRVTETTHTFQFLKDEENKKFNRELQNANYRSWLESKSEKSEKIRSLFFHSYRSQSQPKLDPFSLQIARIYELRVSANKIHTAIGLRDFLLGLADAQGISKVSKSNTKVREMKPSIFHSLRRLKGWGPKISALFVKSLAQIHLDRENEGLRFLNDATIDGFAPIHLPVDAVIAHIFNSHLKESGQVNFKSINAALRELYKSESDMIIWDDLWFWGFITQGSFGKRRLKIQTTKTITNAKYVRKSGINMPKFWSIENAPVEHADEINKRAKRFLDILQGMA
jgi:hypothetical protein